MNILELPADVLYSIFLFLDVRGMPFAICKKWYKLFTNETWWRLRYENTMFYKKNIPKCRSWRWSCQVQSNPVIGEITSYREPDSFPIFEFRGGCIYSIKYEQNNKIISETHYSGDTSDVYIGMVNKTSSVRNGLGIYRWTTSNDFYVGEWSFGEYVGQGTYYWEDGRIYSGGFKNQKLCGHGTFIFPDGAIFEGEFKKDGRSCGRMIWRDGSIYDGFWVRDSSGQRKEWDGFLINSYPQQREIVKRKKTQ